MKTELGKIASMVQSASQAATPLEKKLESFSKKLIQITVLLVLLIFVAGWMAGNDFFTLQRVHPFRITVEDPEQILRYAH